MEFLWVSAHGGVVRLDEVPGNLLFGQIGLLLCRGRNGCGRISGGGGGSVSLVAIGLVDSAIGVLVAIAIDRSTSHLSSHRDEFE
jgi:hypothetical protein